MKKLSVVLATRNEEKNIKECLLSVQQIADEIIVVDEGSTDRTREIAKGLGARVFKVKHEPVFHVTKQKALDKASGDWILQLDADERVTSELGSEIKNILNGKGAEKVIGKKLRLFKKHQKLIEERDEKIGKGTGEIVAYFLPRMNFFLGRPLKYAGVYPDGVIRLVKKGSARFPQKSVHEQIEVDGKVGWLANDLEHHDSPTLSRYLSRLNRYTGLKAEEFKVSNVGRGPFSFIFYSFCKPFFNFLKLYIRHKGFLDGVRGFLWSFFSSLHFPVAYYKYWVKKKV